MSLIDKLGARAEAVAFYDEVNLAVTPVERGRIIRAGERLGWAITWRLLAKVGIPVGVLTTVALSVLGSQLSGRTPPGIASEPTINIVAREPGAAYNVAAFCNDPLTIVGREVLTDAPQGGIRYVALRGTEDVNWPDSPIGGNPGAQHHWQNTDPRYVKPDGSIAIIGEQLVEPVEVTKPAADCLRKKAK